MDVCLWGKSVLRVIVVFVYICVFWLGGDLCEVGAALHCSRSATGGAELPGYRHPPRNASGGEVCYMCRGMPQEQRYGTGVQIDLEI